MTLPRLILPACWTPTHPFTVMQTSPTHAQEQPESPPEKRLMIHTPHPVLETDQSHP